MEESVYQKCKREGSIAIGWLPNNDLSNQTYEEIYSSLIKDSNNPESRPSNDANTVNAFINEMQIGDIVLIYNDPKSIRDIGVVDGEYRYDSSDPNRYPHKRKVVWIEEFKEPKDIYELNGRKRLTLKTIYELSRIDSMALLDLVVKEEDHGEGTGGPNFMPHYLIIDEINRGNIPKIFGEVITLLEKDKRGLKCLLPYSKKLFSIPPNLFVIGTMNTADKSIAVLDTALRRRFIFDEINPSPGLIAEFGTSRIEGVNLEKLLNEINNNIAQNFDRDHRIGHSYFMNLYSLKDLHLTWYFEVMPLLLDYFYNDPSAVVNIVGKAFFQNEDVKELDWRAPKGQISEFASALKELYEGRLA